MKEGVLEGEELRQQWRLGCALGVEVGASLTVECRDIR